MDSEELLEKVIAHLDVGNPRDMQALALVAAAKVLAEAIDRLRRPPGMIMRGRDNDRS